MKAARCSAAPARLASLCSAPSLRSGRYAYATKSRQKWLDIRGYRRILECHAPNVHKRGGLNGLPKCRKNGASLHDKLAKDFN